MRAPVHVATCPRCSRATPAPLLHRWLAIDSSEFCIGGLYCSRHEMKVMRAESDRMAARLDVLIGREEGRVAGLKEAQSFGDGCICPHGRPAEANMIDVGTSETYAEVPGSYECPPECRYPPECPNCGSRYARWVADHYYAGDRCPERVLTCNRCQHSWKLFQW
jgi:hypothetical protein